MPTIKLNFPKPANVFNKQIYDSLFDYSHFIEVWYGGASSGKSHGVVQKVVLKTLKHWDYPRKVLWLRKVDRTIQDSIFTDVLDCLSTWQLLPLCKVNNSTVRFTYRMVRFFCLKGWMIQKRLSPLKDSLMWLWKKRRNSTRMTSLN